jgi:uncharacterized lipoprotein
MSYIRILLMIALGLILAACNKQTMPKIFSDRSTAYLNAHEGRKLIIPPGLSNKKIGDAYSIPPSRAGGPLPAPLTPPGD